MSRFQKVLTVLFCIIVLFALAPTGGAFAQTEGPFGDPTCGDYIDNDGDGNKDSADTDCYNNVGDPDVDDDGDGRTENAGDCNDDDPTIYSGALKICDGKDNNCDGKKDFTTDEDKDNDGVPWCAGDCDDNNPNRAPNIIEAPMGSPVCLDGIDNDCDNKADSVDPGCQFSCFDSDGDGYGINGDASCDFPGEIDCNDNDATINPGQTDDSCNGIDNNCSTVIDDEYVIDTLCGVGECLTNNTASSCVGGVETLCIPGSSSPEGVVGSPSCTDGLDNDCDGLSDTDPACQVSCQDFDEDGYGVLVDASCQFAGIDCDDSNALINPGGDDANCNGIDEDCVGGADSGYAVDSLCGTGECQTNNTPSSCTGGVETLCQPGTPVAEDTPGVGVCIDGVDNDCDGLIDTADSEGCSSLDVDDDGDGFTENQNDCNDADATIYPGAPKICDGKDNNCDGKRDFTTDVDADLDGVPWCAGDCDDNNPNRAPNLFEGGFGSAVCTDGIDNDCDNKIDFADPPCQGDCIDTDGDGYGVNGDVSCDIPGEIDCDDTNAAVNPAGDDANCNGIDEDCVGGADSGYVADTLCGTGECQANNTPSTCVGGVETACQPGAPVLEGPQGDPTCSGGLDEDCDDLIDGNDPGCNTPCIDQDGDGYGANGDPSCPSGAAVDCDDSNAAVNPAGDDANCNGIDEDCAGGADDGYIPDTDCGTGECQTNNTPSSCTGGVETACEPGDPGVENTPFVGACIDGLDNDCDGLIDALPGLEDPDCFDETIDNDGDGYCKAASCTDGSSPNDCDDTDPNVYPGAPKICDGKDSNCDGKKDSPTDEDKDLDGVPWCAGDCDDNDPLAYPGNTEGPFGDPTCSDGRDNDCQNGADAVDPACVVSCETSNDTKDGLHVETMRAPGPDGIPNTADDIDHPESNNLLCGKCHGATLQDPIRYACDRCHEAGGTSKAAYPDPWPFGFGSAPDVMVHSSTVVGTKYGAWDMDCLTCHNPHLQEQDRAYGTSYGKYIKEYICFDNPVTAINVEEIVEFTAPTGPGSFADGPPLNENICNMCHTQTNHHRRDDAPPAPGGQDHNNGQDCAGCHPHIDGFAPSGGEADAPHNNIANPGIFPNCSVCHVSESDFLTPVPSANCLNCHDETAPNKAGGGSDIKVRSHFIGTMECIECHNPMFAQINFRGNPNLSHVRTVVNGNQIAFEAKTGPFSFADDTNAAANGMLPENYICNTCHTATAHHRGDGSLLPADQSHNDGIDCTGCHTHQGGTIVPDAFRDHIENSQAHAPHNNTANPGLFNTCDVCHVTESDYVTPVPNTKCLNCHSVAIGQTGPVDSHHTAGDGSQCIDCHNPMREQINFRGNPNLSHIRTSINGTQIVLEAKTGDYGFAANGSVPPDMTLANYVCNTCHTQTNHHQADGTAPLGQSHNNGLDCTLCHTHPGTAASGDAFRDHPVTIADQPHNSTATPGFNDDCNLCHVDNVPPLVPIPNSKCNGCHAVGTPDQAGGGADTKLETHHTPVDSDCVECHNPMGQTGGNAYHIRLIVNGEPIVFTGVNDYAAGDGTGLCEVCHTSNTYYVNAANQPAQFPDHNVGSNCTTASCHTHETGMEPPIVLADAPHDTITDCTLCHDPGTYVDGADIDKAKCYNCHGPAGPATTVETHHTPADLNCTDCHNPMNPTGNWKHVKPTVDGATIVFGTPTTAPTAVQYADEAGNGLCEVCHDSLTLSYYNSDGSGLPHNAGAICTTCHTHPTGFVPPSAFADVPHETITDCTLCHDDGTYVDGATLNNTKCLGCHGPAGPATTVETHHTPADLNCTDCHNPMNVTGTWKHVKPTVDGSPITFGNPTTAPAAGEYADGAGNGLCEVCHDSLTLSYYNSDGSGLPHMTDVCTTCHTHDTGMVPPITPLADVPHNTITDCTQCHSGDDYADGATLDNNKCLGCHGPAGPATTVETHHTPADLNCTDCHNPMNVTGTWKHVKPTVDGTLITFGTPTTAPAAGEYADGAGNGLCEVCHDSLTLSYYNSDGSGLPHMTDVCTICHTHDTGMVPPTTPLADVPHDTITDCTQCHSGDDYADGATLDNNKCLGCHGAAGPATTVETHHTPADLNCTDCHNPMNPTGNWKHVKPTVDGSPITFGTPTTAPTAVQYADEAGNGLCEVCHDAGTLSYYNSDGSGLPHNAGAICTTCHTHPTGFVPPSAFADVPHETITDCTLCHDDGTYVDGATLNNTKCLGCHGPAGPATTVETHHTPADLNCTDCHNPMNVTGTWKHVKPTVDGSPITFGTATTAPAAGEYADGLGNGLCEVCHDAGTLSYYNSDGSGLPHNAGAICTTCHTHPTGFVPPSAFADVPHETITDCTLCHDDGTYVDGATLNNTKCLGCHGPAGPATTVETHHTPADLNCTDCHNPMNVTGTWKHVKPTVDGSPITFGNPTTAPAAGEYADGAGNGLCEVCHDSLTLSYYNSDGSGLPHMTDVCTTCHTHDTGMVPPTTPLADVPHNTITDCTQCHSGDDYADGATLDNNKCLGCHGPAGPATTVETHHTPADLNCTDCHNPMNVTGTWKHVKPTVDGTLITFGTPTTAPAAGEYADGAGNGLCEVCHDSLTLSYYNSDGSGLPHMTDVCTICHTHDTGMVPPTTPLADVPHDTITDCTQCHSGDDYADGATLDNNKCLGCHGAAGPATTVETHHTPADLNCTDCHNPMNPTGNWKHVKPTVDGSPITFGTPTTAPTAVQYADEAGNGLCEVCHDSLTLSYYNSDGSGLPHNAGAICTTCHTHPTGFVPPSAFADVPHETITDCTLCHDDGTYVDGATLDNNKCLGCHGPAGPATTVETHHTPADLNCTDCHNPMNVTGTWKHVKPTVDGSPITFGNPTTAPAAGEYADGAGNGLCEVCHDSLTLSYYNSDGSGLPHMTDVCTTCHTHDTGMVPPTTPLADVPHNTITDCTQCHSGDDYADGATLDNNKCLGCHGPAGPATTVETHHTPADLNCTDCHNPMNATGTWRHIKTTPVGGSAVTFGTPTTAPSAGEYADGLGSGLCEVCHTSLTLDYYNSDGSGFSHNDGSVCTSCHTHDTGMAPPIVLADTPHDGITDCTLCHDPGTYVDGADIDKAKCYNCHGPAGPATTVETHHTPADLNCTDCHNPMNPTGNWKHVKPTVDGSTIVFGTPTTAPTAIQYADEAGNGLCEVCHDSLTLTYYNSDGSGLPHNAGAICTTCHTHPAGFTPSAFADVPHDGITDCTLCHDPGTYVDGATLNNSKCLGCHGPAGPATTVETHHTPADLFCTDCHNPMNVTGTYRHIKSTVDGATIVFGTPTTPATGGEYADGLGNGLCEVCHDSLTLAYYNSDGSGFSHNDGSVCTSCHTHDTGMVPPQPPADTPHDTITDCTLCHDPGTYVDDATLDNNKCLGCHGPAGPATTVETHHTPPDLNCTDCHNPMNPQGSNLSHIRTSLANFTANAAGADFADGSGNGICETCHVGTKYYNQTGTGQPHETDACTNCHMHLEGFVQPDDPADAPHNVFTDCSVCHTPGSYVLNAAIPNSKCNNCHAVGTPDAGAGGANTKVETHHTPADEDCVTCHNPMRSQGTNLSHIRTSLAVFTANAAGADFANGTGSGICETCHVSTTYYNNTGTGQPHFTDACTNCHLHEGGFVPVVEADAPHDTIPDCYYCHVVSGFSTPIPDSKCEQCHTPDGVLKDSYPSAPDVLTHSSVNHPTGSAYTYTNNCIDCHNPMYAQDGNAKHIRTTLAVFTGADYIHSDPNYDGICETCHVNTRHHRNAASQPAPIMPHNNTIPCTNCHAHEAGFIPGDAPPPPHVTQPCGTCHVTPDTYVLGAAIPNSACLSCHDLAAPGSHIIGWGDCRTESGTTDLSAGMSVRNVSLTTPISNTSKAFLLVDSSGPQSTIQGRDHMVSGYIAGTNTLTFEREGNSGIAEVSYAVVECLWDEFTVQRGEIQLNNGIASNTATISDVDPAMSMVIVNARTNIAKEEQHQALVTGKMLDQTTVEVERAASATSADTSVRYEVVEFSADSGVKIQTGEIDFNGDSSLLVHVPTPVLKESSWLYFSYDATDDGPQENAISGQLTTINRLSFYRHENSPFDNRIRYYLVEFPEQQVLVQRGVSSYQGGASQAVTHDITIPTPVSNLDKAFTFVTNTSAGRGDTLNIDPNGTFIEAENYTNTLPGAGLITETIIGGELHGGTSLVTSGGANLIKCDDIIAQNQAGIEYNVNFTTPGTYTIWMRGNSVKFTKDSHAVGFYTGTEPAEGCIAVLRQNQNRRWTWSKSTETHSAPGGVDIGSAQFTVSAPGTYKLRVWIAENGHYLDGIYIDSINSVPTTSNHGIMVDSTDPQAKLFPRNRWTEQLTSTSNIRMSNWRGETEEADADFDWQVIDFVGSPRGDSGSDMKVDRHFSDNYIDPSTGSLMDITCVECHNPMRPQSNLKFIRSTIRSNTVNFTSFYEMAGDSAPYDGVCEVCHTQTLYHRNDGTETDSDHGIGSDCRWCHKHRYGQKPVVVPAPPHDGQEYQDTCTLCHVNDINYSLPIPDSKCNACHTLGGSLYSSYPTAQIVVTHASANNPESPHNFSITCVDCHLPMWEVTNLAQIRTRIADSIVPGSDVLFTSLTGTDSFADGPPYEENICDTCHSQTNHHQSDGTAPGGQSHNDGLYCAGCHPHGDGFLYSENNCVYCHNQSPPFTSSDTDRRQIVEFIPGDGEGEFVKRSHHVINGATVEEIVRPDDCRVCHDQSNHQQFGDGQTVLVNDPDNPGVSHTYDGTGKSIEVFCLGCHDNDDSQVYGPQPFIGAGDINNPPQIGWETDVVSHSVAYTNAACFNCHGDETGAVNGHGSANPYMHKYTYVPGESHLFCYNCHDGSLNNPDVRAAFDLPFSHRTGSEECKTCHDQHKSEMGLHVEGSENLADMIGGVNKGMGFDYQYEICFQCHDIPITKTNLNSENDMDVIFGGSGVYATYWSTMPDVQSQFSTDNLAYHPLFAAGLNQPSNSLNSAWDTSPYRKDDSAPGGPFDGLDNNFVDNWKSTSLVTCSDCHGNGTVNGARGIHGSDYPWLNRRVETDKKVTTAGAGVIFPNVQGPNELHTASNFCVNCHRADIYGFGSANAEPPVWQNDFSRIDHSGSSGSYNRNCKKANIESSKGGFAKIGCSNCHGGSEVAGIHGTNLTATGPGNRQLGERFMNGNSRAGQVLSGNSVSCYATTTPEPLNVQLSSCNQHRTKASQPVDFQYSY